MPDATPPKKPLCFVVGPIGDAGTEVRKHADFLLNGIIRHVLEAQEFGYKVKRADEDADPGMISDRVITDIIHADLVVADLSGLNPNALYELGIRHAAEKPVIHIAKAGTPLPFDNHAHRAIFVDLSDWQDIEAARTSVAASARAVREPAFRVSNPITQANASFQMRASADPRDRTIADMESRLSRIESIYNAEHAKSESDQILSVHLTEAAARLLEASGPIDVPRSMLALFISMVRQKIANRPDMKEWALLDKRAKRVLHSSMAEGTMGVIITRKAIPEDLTLFIDGDN